MTTNSGMGKTMKQSPLIFIFGVIGINICVLQALQNQVLAVCPITLASVNTLPSIAVSPITLASVNVPKTALSPITLASVNVPQTTLSSIGCNTAPGAGTTNTSAPAGGNTNSQ